jgi:hypothetical protein
MAAMTAIKALVITGGIALVLGVAVYWWADTPPRRPPSVSGNAVFLWGPPVGLPAPKRGGWIMCWFDSQQKVDRCRIAEVNGSLLYEGIFVSYEGQASIPDVDLVIDSKTTNLAQERVAIDATSQESMAPATRWVPLIYLRNGEVLIPQKGYDRGRQRLDELRKSHSPYAPTRGLSSQ